MNSEKIWQDYRHRLLAFIRSHLRHPQDAEDILQEVFVKTLQNLHQLDKPENLQAWLYQITRNTIADHYRQLKPTEPPFDFEQIEAPEVDSDLYQQLSDCIQPFVGELPEKYAKAIKACDLEGRKQKDYALDNDLSHSAVKSQVQRGRELLTKKLQACCEFEINHRNELMDYRSKSKTCTQC